MSVGCQDDYSDVNITQLNNIRRCFVLQKRELDRINEKKLDLETENEERKEKEKIRLRNKRIEK